MPDPRAKAPSSPVLGLTPDDVAAMPTEALTPLLVALGALQGAALARLAASPTPGGNGERLDEGDLDAMEVAKRLGMSKRWVYDNAEQVGFGVRRGRRLCCPARLVEKYRAEQERRATRI